MSDAVQQAFMRALLDMPGVTQRSVATRIGVNRCMVTRWLSGERNLRLGDAMYLVERWGSRPLVEAARVVGLTLRVDEDDDVDGIEGDTAEVRITFLAGLAAETSRLAADLASTPDTPDGRAVLIQRVRDIEDLCRKVQLRLLRAD